MTGTTAQESTLPIPINAELLQSDGYQQLLADDITAELTQHEGDIIAAGEVISAFTTAAANHPDADAMQWLMEQFSHHAALWPDHASMRRDAEVIVASVTRHAAINEDLDAARNNGKSRENWLAKSLSASAQRHGTLSVGDYGNIIDDALMLANAQMQTTVMRIDGGFNQSRNLDGFIAETHHVNTFNVNAVASGADARAELVFTPGKPFGKNSVDIQIKDSRGKVVRRYQSKYGSDAKVSETLFEKGDYAFQRKLVPEGHAEQFKGIAHESIEFEGVRSTPLSKEEAKRLQYEVQQKQNVHVMDWKSADGLTVAKRIGKDAAVAVGLSICLQAGVILARRSWNALNNKKNPALKEEGKAFINNALMTSGSILLNVSASGALMVAARRGLFGSVIQNTPAGRIAAIASVAMDNTRIAVKLYRGDISKEEALDSMTNTTFCAIAGLVAAGEGASLGAAIGMVIGPVGSVVGGFAGGIIGGMAGSKVAEQFYKGRKSLISKSLQLVNNARQTLAGGMKAFGNALSHLFA